MFWVHPETMGSKPPAMQGHGAVKHGVNLYLAGGCDYRAETCYNDTYLLNTETLFWTKVDIPDDKVFAAREEFSLNAKGAFLYAFGGCQML